LPDWEAGLVDPKALKAIRNLELRFAFHRVPTNRPMDLALQDFLRRRHQRTAA
jgi:hypothetical protein